MMRFDKYVPDSNLKAYEYGTLKDAGELASFSVAVDPEKVVWHNEKRMVLQTGEEAWQVYERIPESDDWERLPRGRVVIYTKLEAAIAAANDDTRN
jgi:hypothetical protein